MGFYTDKDARTNITRHPKSTLLNKSNASAKEKARRITRVARVVNDDVT